jgi:electron transport complex protein RnfD
MMIDVLIGLAPVMGMAVVVFRWYAVVQVGLCVLSCLAAETAFTWMRGRRAPIGDGSAAVTGVILGLSLPWSAPWYVAVIGSAVAIGLGKVVFGGLGCNVFNPAMVGRAFVMLSFARALGASAYVTAQSELAVLTQATPLTVAKKFAADLAAGKVVAGDLQVQFESAQQFWPLFVGQVNGSLGETSALAVLLGGFYLCVRRSASWEIPAGVLLAAFCLAGLADWANLTPLTAVGHLLSGALLFGAFFIATDPVTSPLTARGKFIFGLGIGVLVMVIRLFSSYPEGVMFAVLVMNAVVPLLNRWIPRPLGGPTPKKA